MNENINLSNINKINLKLIKILFLGYGGVAKCVLNYFKYYFDFDITKVYLIDKFEKTFYGPVQSEIPETNKYIVKIQSENFDEYIIKKLNFSEGDLIIDLTYCSNTYYFVKRCLELGINYINTSIEDYNDNFLGTSICLQQYLIKKQFNEFKINNKIKSNVLIEFGQNPGLIQHYVIYALNKLAKLKNPNFSNTWNISELKHVITDYKIGTILMSEIDEMKKTNDVHDDTYKLFNTWSVSGFLGECLDNAELVYGKKNKFVKPQIPNYIVDNEKNLILKSIIPNNDLQYDVLFLHEIGINCTLYSISPTININGDVKYCGFDGRLIHHGEIFEFASIFGDMSPFMSYCYKINKYAEHSLIKNMNKTKYSNSFDLKLKINNSNDDFFVYDNHNTSESDKIIGYDSIGCTIFCGDKDIDAIYWCGSILSSNDSNIIDMFTPTIIQVASGVLTGISYIMEPINKLKGLILPCDLDTPYVLEKSIKLLGKFFFTQIPIEKFNKKSLQFKINKIV